MGRVKFIIKGLVNANSYKKIYTTFREIHSFPKLSITLTSEDEECEKMYHYFMQRHPRFLLIRNKTIGVGAIALKDYRAFSAFLQSVSGKNSAAYYARRCAKMGYATRIINPDEHHDEIMAVNLSAEYRQGSRMIETYHKRIEYPMDAYNLYWGIFKDGVLYGYCCVKINGELRLFNRLLGHAAHLQDGIMYKMLLDIIGFEFGQFEKDPEKPVYIAYDTFLGASEGLKLFKRRMGFRPYKVKWLLK